MFKKALTIMPWLVIATAVIPIVTVVLCFSITKILGHVPEVYVLPQISLTGNHPPERWIYLIGFGSTSLLMMFMMIVLHTEVVCYFLRRSWVNKLAIVTAFFFSLGLFTQSVFCLQENFADYSSSSSSLETVEDLLDWLETTTVLHLLGAGVFFMCALFYVIVMVIALFNSIRELPKSIPDGFNNPFGGFWYRWKAFCLGLFVVFLLLSDFGGNLFDDIKMRIFAGAFGQWACVLSFILFCFSFSFDIKRFIQLNPVLFRGSADGSVPSAVSSAPASRGDDDSKNENENAVMMSTLSPTSPSSKKGKGKKEEGSEVEKQSLMANDGLFTIDDDEDAPIDDEGEIKPEDLL